MNRTVYSPAEEAQQRADSLKDIDVTEVFESDEKPNGATAQTLLDNPLGIVPRVRTDKVVKLAAPAPDFWALQA